MAKECPITRAQFEEHATAVSVAGVELAPKTFSTDTVGWEFRGKMTVVIDGVEVPCQADLKLYVIGSKRLD